MPYPLVGLSILDVGDHLNFAPEELARDNSLIFSIVKAAIAHTETLVGTLTDPVPDDLIAAIKLLCGHLYENREDTIYGTGTVSSVPNGYAELILNHRQWAF
jgi:hypothetical protein